MNLVRKAGQQYYRKYNRKMLFLMENKVFFDQFENYSEMVEIKQGALYKNTQSISTFK